MTEENASLNLIGTLALKIHDLQMDAAVGVSGLSPNDCACLISVAHQDVPPTIKEIAEICRLSHSATVRLVAKLEKSGYVRKVAAESDRREVYVRLTAFGYETRDAILRARRSAIEPVLAVISSSDRKVIERAAGVILSELTGSRLESEHTCRHCDAEACGGAECPVEKKAMMLDARVMALQRKKGGDPEERVAQQLSH